MATVEKLTVGYNRKIQLDQFEPITFSAERTVRLEESDDPKEVYHEQAIACRENVERELAARATQTRTAEAEQADE